MGILPLPRHLHIELLDGYDSNLQRSRYECRTGTHDGTGDLQSESGLASEDLRLLVHWDIYSIVP